MAVNYTFDTKYAQQYGEPSNNSVKQKYRIVIGHISDEDIAVGGEMDLLSPGMTLDWGGDQDRFMSAFMGSTLSFTSVLDDAQLEIWDDLLDLEEGRVFALFFDKWGTVSHPYWYGHLVIESTTIRIADRRHIIDLEFTDGLASLRGKPWKTLSGNEYEGFQDLRYWVHEIIKKLPARAAFENYVLTNQGASTHVRVMSEIGFPDARPNGDANAEFHHYDSKFEYLRVRGETFMKPKKQVDRHRALPALPDYFATSDVLEDVCKAFGATACMFDGYINFMCRLDVATMKGKNVASVKHKFNSTQTPTWETLHNVSASSGDVIGSNENDYLITDADDLYEVLNGAVKRRSLPMFQANLTHEEGGSDWLYCQGYFLDDTISHIDLSAAAAYVQHAAWISSGLLEPYQTSLFAAVDGNRRDLWHQYLYRSPNYIAGSPTSTDQGFPTDPAGQDSVDLPFFKFPADITDYTGFPAKTVNDLEFQSGETMKIEFSDTTKFTREKTFSYALESDAFREFHVGKTLIMRLRIEVTTTDGTKYRLRRPVTTHVNTNGSPDGINIDNNGLGYYYFDDGTVFQFGSNRSYYRKVYQAINWVKEESQNFSDAWVEFIIPDGNIAKADDGWGTDTYENYDAQYGLYAPDYAPIGCQLENDEGEEGQGVQYEKGEDSTFIQYYGGQLEVNLPFDFDDGSILDFESFFFEQGYSYWNHDEGPRPNNGASYNPIWRTAYADGTGGYRRYNGSGSWRTLPEYIHNEAMRVTVGNGEETQDFVTKIQGGDGYEIAQLGSSRIGSRLSFVNTHVGGTLWANRKASNDPDDFLTVADKYTETLQWRGHSAGDVAGSLVPAIVYDSLHSYVCNAFLDLFGESRVVYDMTLIPSQSSQQDALLSPFHVIEFKKLVGDKSNTEFLMPLSFSWTMDGGIQGSFLKVGHEREKSSLFDSPFPIGIGGGKGKGTPTGKFAPGKNIGGRISRNGRKMHKITIENAIDLDQEKGKINDNQSQIVLVKQVQEEEEMNKLLSTRPTTGLTSKANPSVQTRSHTDRTGD